MKCGRTPPIVAFISNCTQHLADDWKKDVRYIVELFNDYVAEFDPHNTDTDVFYFDGTSNVQKAGRVLAKKILAPSASTGPSM